MTKTCASVVFVFLMVESAPTDMPLLHLSPTVKRNQIVASTMITRNHLVTLSLRQEQDVKSRIMDDSQKKRLRKEMGEKA